MPFQAVSTQRLYQQVAEQVAALIRGGELEAGSRLPPERDLAKRLGVSRPTIREAMIALELAGLVEVRTGSGIYVRAEGSGEAPAGRQASFDAGSFDAGPGAFELLAARLLIEPEIAAEAARSLTDADLAALRDTVRVLEDAGEHRASQEADRAFHTLIARASGNGVLVSIVEDLWASMFSPIFEALSARTGLPDSRRMTLADHRAIVERLEARDPEGARAAMRRHLEHVRAILNSHAEPQPAEPEAGPRAGDGPSARPAKLRG
jgi:DNA-binding FadR family transcriptional regulator